ncbi:MAG TPA: uroporphyrinogen decarboxylase family protein [Bacillota bacterium]|nr:hypothetical protein [Clostridiales bacterium]HPT85636.1 uroporphyrinogen decarboxylase family protein [Bacillota bacterium]
MAIIRGIAMSDKMTPREIIRRVVAHRDAPRIGWNFSSEHNDFIWVPGRAYLPPPPDPYARWGNHEELKKLTGFSGEVYRDRFGNIYGRYGGKTKGECIRGAIVEWDDFEEYKKRMPEIDPSCRDRLLSMNLSACDKYVITGGASLFSALRDARLMANALADVLLEPEMVTAFLDCIVEHELKVLDYIAGTGVDAAMFGDDWGTQTSTFISPESFRELFFPQYKRIFEAYHERGIAIFLHSCGYIYNFIPMFIEAGVDVFQFDQPDAYPSERLSEEFGDKAVFHSPVDIQKVLPTGDLELIGRRAAEMCEIFDKNKAWIAKDYPTYHDIGVDPAWAKHAENVIVERTKLSPDGSI